LAASQKTGSVESKFEAAGAVATTAATFTLTTGVDTGAAFTGGAGNDTFNATVATLGALDSIDGGAGTDTLSITDTASIGSRTITVANVEIINASSAAGSVGNASATAKLNAQQSVTWALTAIPSISLDVTVGGVKRTFDPAAGSTYGQLDRTKFVTFVNEVLNDALGAPSSTSGLLGSGGAYATADSSVAANVLIEANTAGVALPTISIAKTVPTASGTLTTSTTTNRANQVASDAVSSTTFAVPTGATTASISAATQVFASSVSTADTTVVATAGTASLTGGKSQTVTAGDSVTVSGSTGAIVVTATAAPSTELTAYASTTNWDGGAGIYVRGGSTVTITDKAGTVSSTTGVPAASSTPTQVGADPSVATSATNSKLAGTTASGYPETIAALSSAPTGDVSITKKSNYTNTSGYKDVKYGTGPVDVFMNGGTTATVSGAAATNITDMQTVKTKASATAEDLPGTSKLTTVNLSGVSGTTNIKTDAIQNLSIVDTGAVTVTINSNTGKNNVPMNLSVGNTSSTVVVNAQASAIAITGVTSTYESVNGTLINAGSANTLTLQAGKATSLSFAGSSDVTINGASSTSTLGEVTSITSTSAKKVTLGDVSSAANSSYLPKLSSIDASGASGALSVTIGVPGTSGGTGYGMNVKGGSGNDSVTLKAGTSTASVVNVDGVTVTTSVALGAGNDKLVNGGSVAGSNSATLSNTSTIDGGEGSDTISVSLLNSGNAAIAKNFEILDVKGSTSGTTSFDASLLTNSTITGVAVSGNIGGTTTVSNISGTALTVSISDTGDAAGSLTATLATSTGSADTATVTYAGVSTTGTTVTAQTSQVGTFRTTGIESVAIVSGATLTNVGDTMSNIMDVFRDASNKTATITITGSNAFTLGGYVSASSYTDGVTQFSSAPTIAITDVNTAAALKTIDASGATGAVTIVAGETQSDVHGDDGTTNLIFTGLTITGGSGADKLVNLAASGIVNGGDGADAITVTGSAAVVDGGAGNDTITVNASVSTTLTGGAGANTYVLTAATAGALATSAPIMTTITDYKTSDTLSIGDALPWQKANVSSAGSLLDALALAAADGDAGNASWFTWGNFTYIVKDSGSGGTADDTLGSHDVIVKLTGIYELSVLTGDATTGLVGLA
jgi:hypothetical protein